MFVGTVVGNLGGDATQKQVGDSTVVEFSVASTKKIKGEKHTQWIRAAYWGKAATAVAPYLKKGGTVACTGDVELREFTKKDGSIGTSLEMRVNSLQLCGSKQDSGATDGYQPRCVTSTADDGDALPF
jgi:single-strand DNA-binding protein